MASLSGTFTVANQASIDLYLYPGEVVRTTLTVTGAATIQLQHNVGPNTALLPLTTLTATGVSDYRNTTAVPMYVRLLAVSITGSTAWALADIAGDQVLEEWRSADGTLVARMTDQGLDIANGILLSRGVSSESPPSNIYSIAIGEQTLEDNTSGQSNVAVGYQNLKENTTGSGNTAVGTTALIFNTTGTYNTGVGVDALYTNVGGYSNSAFGADALGFNTEGRENTAVGFDALFLNETGNHGTSVGFKALYTNVTGSRNVALGCGAGYHETGDGHFYLDSVDSANLPGGASVTRTSIADDRAGALLYGTFNATPSSQTLKVNGVLTVGFGLFSGQYQALFGAKSGTNQIASFSTDDGTLGDAGMQLNVINNEDDSMQLQAYHQGVGAVPLDINGAGGGLNLGSAAAVISTLGLLSTLASGTGTAGFRLPHGAAPTAPVNGDVWTTTAGLFVRIDGSTVGPLS